MLKYRKKHRKCKFCKYYNVHSNLDFGLFYKECILKDDLICNIIFKNSLCKWYQLKEDIEDELNNNSESIITRPKSLGFAKQ